jgi:threonine/homoserine/homoserine lactone efflux protein
VISPEFLLTALIVVLMPEQVFFTRCPQVSLGERTSFYAAFGCTLGILPHLLATVGGLAAVSTLAPLPSDSQICWCDLSSLYGGYHLA